MLATRRPLPFEIEEVYGDHPIQKETMKLLSESNEKPGKRSVRVRLLTDFLFVKNGKFVYPYYERCTEEFWKEVEVWGFMMSAAGTGKWLAWSLLWHLDWLGKNMELVRIGGVYGMSKETNRHYRNGNQMALWVYTRRHVYALMEPEERIAEEWAFVCASWQKSDNQKLPVPFCGPVSTVASVPAWWHEGGGRAGVMAWEELVAKQTEYEGNRPGEEDAEGEEEEEEDMPAPHKRTSGTRKGKEKQVVSAKRKRSEPSLSGRGASERSDKLREADKTGFKPRASSSKSLAPPAGPADKRSDTNAVPESSREGAPAASEHEAPPRPSEDEASGLGPPSKRSRALEVEEPTGETASAPAVVSPMNQAAMDRLQPESEASSIPKLSTQQANTLFRPKTDDESPVLVPVNNSSSATEEGSPSQTQSGSFGSQLARDVRGLSLARDGSEERTEGGDQEHRATVQFDAQTLESVAPKNVPGTEHFERPRLARSESLVLSVPDAAVRSDDTSRPERQPQVPPVALSVPSTTPPPHHLLPPRLPAQASETPALSAVGSATDDAGLPVPGSSRSVASSLEDRSSRRHKRMDAA